MFIVQVTGVIAFFSDTLAEKLERLSLVIMLALCKGF